MLQSEVASEHRSHVALLWQKRLCPFPSRGKGHGFVPECDSLGNTFGFMVPNVTTGMRKCSRRTRGRIKNTRPKASSALGADSFELRAVLLSWGL